MIRKNEYYPIFIKLRRNELGVNSIIFNLDKLTNKNLINLYKSEIMNIDNLIIFIEFLKEFISVFLHKYKYENLVEEMFDMYSNMLDGYYKNERKPNQDEGDNNNNNNEIYNINNDFNENNNEENYNSDNNYNNDLNINFPNNFGDKNYFENNLSKQINFDYYNNYNKDGLEGIPE